MVVVVCVFVNCYNPSAWHTIIAQLMKDRGHGGQLRTPAFNNLKGKVIFSIVIDQISGPTGNQSFEQI